MDTKPTLPEAPEGLVRRSFLTGLAVTVPMAATVATPALVASGASRSAIDELYAERTELAAQSRELCKRHDAAESAMPWWARPGHEYVRPDGTWAGAHVGWPAIDDDKLPTYEGSMLKKRISPFDIRRSFESNARLWKAFDAYRGDGCGRERARAIYRKDMRELVARLRRQREEERKVGLWEIEAQMEALSDQIFDLEDRIKNLDVPSAEVPQKAAAVLLIESRERRSDDSFGESAMLDTLRPLLTGLISEHAKYVAENPDEPMAAMPFWLG